MRIPYKAQSNISNKVITLALVSLLGLGPRIVHEIKGIIHGKRQSQDGINFGRCGLRGRGL